MQYSSDHRTVNTHVVFTVDTFPASVLHMTSLNANVITTPLHNVSVNVTYSYVHATMNVQDRGKVFLPKTKTHFLKNNLHASSI